MNQIAFQLTQFDHTKAMHLLDEIKRHSNSLSPDNAASGNVINALAESVLWLLIDASNILVPTGPDLQPEEIEEFVDDFFSGLIAAPPADVASKS